MTDGKQIYVIAHRDTGTSTDSVYDKFNLTGISYFHKIGIASNPAQRTSNLGVGTPHKLELVTTLDSDDPEYVEKRLHEIYRISRKRGEWYSLNINAINSLRGLDRLDRDDVDGLPQRKINIPTNGLYVTVYRNRSDSHEEGDR